MATVTELPSDRLKVLHRAETPVLRPKQPTGVHLGATVPERLFRTASRRGSAVAFWRCHEDGLRSSKSWSQVADSVSRLAAGLIRLGVRPQDRVAIWADNSQDWMVADLAVMSCGGVTVPIYATSTPAQAEHIVRDSGARVVFLGSPQFGLAAAAWRPETTDVEATVLLHGATPWEGFSDLRLLSFAECQSLATPQQQHELRVRIEQLAEDDLATIIYTSGTCGQPKGVVFDHGSIARLTDSLLQIVRRRLQ